MYVLQILGKCNIKKVAFTISTALYTACIYTIAATSVQTKSGQSKYMGQSSLLSPEPPS